MELSSNIHLEPDTSLKVTMLGLPGEPSIPGWVVEAQGRRLTMKLPHAIPSGALVKLEGGDSFLLGEVCRLVGDGTTAEVMLSHSLCGLADLQRLNRALIGEEKPQRVLQTR